MQGLVKIQNKINPSIIKKLLQLKEKLRIGPK